MVLGYRMQGVICEPLMVHNVMKSGVRAPPLGPIYPPGRNYGGEFKRVPPTQPGPHFTD